MRILVTGANGDIGEAIGRILTGYYEDAEVHGADVTGDWPGRFVFCQMHTLPHASDINYPRALAVLGQSYDLILPGSEPELACLASRPVETKGLPLLVAPSLLVNTFLDKLLTVKWLEQHGLPVPHTTTLEDASSSDLPLLLKPRRGAGGKGQEIVRTRDRLDLAKSELLDGMVAQELLDVRDQEYTCALFSDGATVRSLTMRRWLAGDRSGKIEVVDIPEVHELLERLAKAGTLIGCINVQLRMMPAGPRIFEINPRISSTVMMRHRLGFSDLIWWTELAFGRTLPKYTPPVPGSLVFRTAQEHVVEAGMLCN